MAVKAAERAIAKTHDAMSARGGRTPTWNDPRGLELEREYEAKHRAADLDRQEEIRRDRVPARVGERTGEKEPMGTSGLGAVRRTRHPAGPYYPAGAPRPSTLIARQYQAARAPSLYKRARLPDDALPRSSEFYSEGVYVPGKRLGNQNPRVQLDGLGAGYRGGGGAKLRDLIDELKSAGWTMVRQKGSHQTWRGYNRQGEPAQVVLPVTGPTGRDASANVVRNVRAALEGRGQKRFGGLSSGDHPPDDMGEHHIDRAFVAATDGRWDEARRELLEARADGAPEAKLRVLDRQFADAAAGRGRIGGLGNCGCSSCQRGLG